jgi:argininosuccinate synthase
MVAYLQNQGIEAEVGEAKRYSTDANLAGLSHEAEDLESLTTPCTIVEPVMGVWPQDAPDRIESVKLRIECGRCVEIDDRRVAPFAAMTTANDIAGRNGIGLRNALENRIIGTKSRGVYEAPGMELLGFAIETVYQATLDRRAAELFRDLSSRVANQIYDGRYFEPTTRAALRAIEELSESATGTVVLGLYKGNLLFQSLSDCPTSLYNEQDSSMEASQGLNPASSQGFVEVQSVEARALAKAGQIKTR